MNFSEVLIRAWQIVWKHKVLWIFGILASCSSGYGGGFGNGGGGNFPRGNYPSSSGTEGFQGFNDFFRQTFGNLRDEQIVLWVIAAVLILILLILIISIISIFLGTVGRIGLIRGVVQIEDGVKTSLSFGELFRGSFPYFWRVFFLNIVVYLGWTIFVFGTIALLILSIIGICVLIPFCCLLLPLGWLLALYVQQSTIAAIVENLSLTEALQRGWKVTRANLGALILMALALMIGGGFVTFLLSLPFILGITFVVLNLAMQEGNNAMTGIVIAAICCVAYIPVLIVLVGILNAYIQSAWTLTYLRITRPASVVPPVLPQAVESQEAS